MQPAKLSYKIYQGSTFQEAYRWESQTKVYVPIQSISKAAPCVITTTQAHNLPTGWRFRVTGVGGMKEMNSIGDSFYTATNTTNNTIEINQINSTQYTTYTSGGILEYNQPVDLSSFNARMQVRKTVSSSDIIYEASSEDVNPDIEVDNTHKTISITIPATTTQSFGFSTAVYSVELYNSSGLVVPFLTGNLTLVQEITR